MSSPTAYVATATTSSCAKGVASMGVYVDNVLVYVANGASLNTAISMSQGPHHTVVEEWDYCGGATYTAVNVSVGSPPSTTAVNVSSPVPGSTVQSPVHYVATAQTAACLGGVASVGVYDNNQLIYTTNGASLYTQIALTSGSHHTVVEEWDYCGGAAYTTININVGTTQTTAVNVTSPAPGSTVQSTVHYIANATTATCAAGIASMGIYVNNNLVYTTNGASLNTGLALGSGPQHTVIEEWDYCGGAAYTIDDITVSGGTGPPTVNVTANPASVTLGSSSTLTVTASNASQVSVTGSDGSSYTLQSSGGTLAVTPSASTTYWIGAKGATGNASAVTLVTVTPPASALIDYPRYKGDVAGTGANTNEFLLTPTNVNTKHFGSPWGFPVDGLITAQLLYMHAVPINGATRNVVYAATNNDTLYAIDANAGTLIWKRSFLSSGVTSVNLSSAGAAAAGILSTPVIDPSTRTMYVVVWTSENNATYFPHRLHAIDITTGNDTLMPVIITDPEMPPLYEYQRPGLLLLNGTIYVAFGSVGDILPYHGYLFAFDAATLTQKAKWNDTPTGMAGGIWMSGAAPTADSAGNIYLSVGNGTFDGVNNFGQSAVKLSPTLSVLDYFTPYDYNSENTNDVDLGSGGAVVVPDQPGPVQHELIACGKPTPIFVINRDNMGKVGSSSDNVVQRLDNALGGTATPLNPGQPCYNSPAIWNNNVYFAANGDELKMFTISPTTGQLSFVTNSSTAYSYPGANPVASSNGSQGGIVWTVEVSSATLHADDATNVSKSLYVSPSMGKAFQWVPPTVANGYVYVAAYNWVVAYTNF